MTGSAFASHVSLTSDDLELLREVWEDWCRDLDVDGSTEDAQLKARSLIDWFQFGISDKRQLRSLLNPL
ncbi:hypothetical protein ASG39_22765 [Rhizobium sp. Leaf371]|nr:hypothetical protein ASG39_22765 [Rhizobium sp. Leaf371]